MGTPLPEIEIEVLGHKAKITCISGRLPDPLLGGFLPKSLREGYLYVSIELDPSTNGISSFGVGLPAKVYGREKFIAEVIKKAEKELHGRLEAIRMKKEWTFQQKEKRQKEIDKIAEKIASYFAITGDC